MCLFEKSKSVNVYNDNITIHAQCDLLTFLLLKTKTILCLLIQFLQLTDDDDDTQIWQF